MVLEFIVVLEFIFPDMFPFIVPVVSPDEFMLLPEDELRRCLRVLLRRLRCRRLLVEVPPLVLPLALVVVLLLLFCAKTRLPKQRARTSEKVSQRPFLIELLSPFNQKLFVDSTDEPEGVHAEACSTEQTHECDLA